ncbi:MAG: MBOAT family protein [Lachnospiraceae bacterium]|nr:MBOAT family protein [Lachnospiraceae bacterium]
MLFNSYIFVFLFFPICLFGYYGLVRLQKETAAKIFLTAMSFWFYGYFNVSYLLIMVCSIGGNYLFHRMLSDRPDKKIMITAVALNLGVLFYFKYYDFFISTVNSVFGTSAALKHILLPLGISFFTFQQISFVIDTYKGEIKDCSLVDYALFVSFFPQLIAGPIVNHSEMLPQFERVGKSNVQWEKIAEGFGLFILGMCKKVLLADTFGAGVDYGYANLGLLGRADAIMVIFFYTLQLYFDFSGYCDMARGIAKMLGMEIPVNFDSPYKASNIVDFWKRWHITLNRFFMKYVYIPLGGNRKGAGRMYLNLMIVFLLSGLWHGAGWNYIVWGAMHGVLYVLTRLFQRNIQPRLACKEIGAIPHKIMTIVSQILLVLYVGTAWVYFRAESVAQANKMIMTAFTGSVQKMSMEFAECFQTDELWYVIKVLHLDNMAYSRYILMWVFFVVGIYLSMIGPNAAQRMERVKYRVWTTAVFAVLTVWCVLTFSEVSTFLYFNF